MKLMIVGQKWLGAEVLAMALRAGYEVTAVAAPAEDDRLFRAALAAGVPVIVERARLTADQVPPETSLIVCAHAHCFITPEARHSADLGAIGYHPSLLPRHRGRDAIRWTLHMGDAIAGGSVYWLDDGADTGPIARQSWCHVRKDDTPESLWRRRLGPMGVELIKETLIDVQAGRFVRLAQDESIATWEPAFKRSALSA